jgi:hypothetical protein
MPRECVIAALIGSCQLYGTIWLQSFSTGFSPLMFLFGYTAGFSHLVLSGMIVNNKKIKRSKKNYFLKFLIGIVCLSCMSCSSGIIYFLKDSEGHLLLIIINSYAIIVVIIWSGIVAHVIGRVIASVTTMPSDTDVEMTVGSYDGSYGPNTDPVYGHAVGSTSERIDPFQGI